MRLATHTRLFLWLLLSVAPATVCHAAVALQCHVEQNGESRDISFEPIADPYTVQPVDFERFRFKAVVVGDGSKIEYVKVYTYSRSQGTSVLLHQSTYLSPPVANDHDARSLTGDQRLYSPIRGHEIQYNCSLVNLQP